MRCLIILAIASSAWATSPPLTGNIVARYKGADLVTNATWPDSSGNGNDATLTSGSPTVTTGSPSGYKGLNFAEISPAWLTIPAGVVVNTQSATICIVSDRGLEGSTNVPVSLGSSNAALYTGNQGSTLFTQGGTSFSTLFMQPSYTSVTCVTYNASAQTVYREFGSATHAALGSTAIAGGFIGAYNSSGDFNYEGTLLEIFVYNVALTSGQITQLMQYSHEVYATPTPGVQRTAQVVCVGDSITLGRDSTLGQDYPNLTAAYGSLYSSAWIKNIGVGGTTLATILTQESVVTGQSAAGYRNVAILFAGTNDLSGCTNTSDCNAKEATLQTNTHQYVADMHAAGILVIVTTMISRSAEVAAFDVARLTFNTWLRTLANSGADGLSDPGGDAHMGVLPQPVGYFADGIHPTNLGYQTIASYSGPTLAVLLNAFGGRAIYGNRVVSSNRVIH